MNTTRTKFIALAALLACSAYGQRISGGHGNGSGSGFANPMTAVGDLIVGGASGTPTRLGATTGYLHWNGSAFVYDTPAASPISIFNTTDVNMTACGSSGGGSNTIIGVSSGCSAGAYQNTGFGNQALGNVTGFYNTGIGYAALGQIAGGGSNVALGNAAGYHDTGGSQNVYIGAGSGPAANTSSVSNSIAIGYIAAASASNQVALGNTSVTQILLGGKCSIYMGSGSPNSVQAGNPCDLYVNTAGGSATTLYVKESGTASNTGWVGK